MNKIGQLAFLLFIFSFLGHAQNSAKNESNNDAPEKKGVMVERSGGIDKFMEIKEVKAQFDACQAFGKTKAGQDKKSNYSLASCMWDGNDNGGPAALSNDIRKEVMDRIGEYKNDQGIDGLKFEGIDLSSGVETNDDISKRLGDFFYERLQKILFEDSEKMNLMDDHTDFNKLYSSQLSRNLTEAMTSFCMQVEYITPDPNDKDSAGIFVDKCSSKKTKLCPSFPDQDHAANKQANLDLLKDPNNFQKAEKHFTQCATNIANSCTYLGSDSTTQPQACGVVKHMKATKQALIQINQADERWKQLGEENKTPAHSLNIKRGQKDFKVDEAVNISSKEISEGSGIQEIEAERKAILEECAKNYEENKCAQYITNADESDRILAEYAIRKNAQNERIQNAIGANGNINKEGVSDYLTEEGIAEEQIKAILADDEKLKEIAEEIKRKYKAEKRGLIAALSSRLNKQKVDISKKDDIAKQFENMSAENRTQELREVIHYSNIVSSFLRICPEGETDCTTNPNTERNTYALKLELEQSAFDPSNDRGVASKAPGSSNTLGLKYSEKQFDQLKELAKDAPKGSDESKSFGVEEINSLLWSLESD